MRTKYLHRLAGEIVSGETAETFRNDAMDRGRAMEPLARAYYERTHLVDVEPVGFVRRTVRPLALAAKEFVIGASPDGLVTKRKGLEIKTMRPEFLMATKKRGTPPTRAAAGNARVRCSSPTSTRSTCCCSTMAARGRWRSAFHDGPP